MRKLAVLSGPTKGTIYALADESISIGRAEGNTIAIDETGISRHHALLIEEGDDYRVRDLNSANGTWVNGQAVTETRLQPGDLLRIGGVELCYRPAAARTGQPNQARRLPPDRTTGAPVVSRPVLRTGRSPLAAPGGPPAGAAPAALAPPAAGRRRPNVWLAVIVTTAACWVVGGLLLWLTGVLPRRTPAAPSRVPVATITPSRPPPGPEQYRDRHGRFVCGVPDGWQVEADVADSRSKVRFFRGQEEIRVIAQPSDQPDLGEADRAAAIAVFRDIARQAGAPNPVELELETAWRELSGVQSLQVDLELDQPAFLWMRQVKFRRAGVDHTIAAYAGSPAAREQVRRVFEEYLAGYQASDR